MKHALYSGSRNLYGDMQTACKSLIANSDVDKVWLLTEGGFDFWLPDICEVVDVSGQGYFPAGGPNMGSKFSYLALMRAALALMPELSGVDKVLSLDVDTICVRNVSGAWNMPVDSCYFSASIEPRCCYKNMQYCNTGVALYNLDMLRDGKAEEVVHALNVRRFPNIEQDAFSFLCQGRIHEMPSEYNANPWTAPYPYVRIAHYAGEEAEKWRDARDVVRFREMTWEEALSRHVKRACDGAVVRGAR